MRMRMRMRMRIDREGRDATRGAPDLLHDQSNSGRPQAEDE
jgi:hypothetical protein